MSAGRALPVLLALCALAPAARAADAHKSAEDEGLFIYFKDDLELVVRTQRQKIPRFHQLHEKLGVKPGMSVLDIGSGTGQQAYILAEKVGPQGKVYASDIEPRLVKLMKKEARARGLKNLEPFLVKPDGLDPAYCRRRYDLVVAYDVFAFIRRPADYFGKLRECLAPGGRVAVVFEPKFSYGFAREDFADWNGFVAELLREPDDSPFGRAVSKPLRESLATLPRGDGVARRKAVMHHLNYALLGGLYKELTAGVEFKPEVAFTEQERPFASWLLHRLHLAGVHHDRNRMELLVIESRDIDMLNKLLLVQRFRKFLKFEGRGPYDSRSWESMWFLERDNVKAAFEAAGYGPGTAFDHLPFQRIWVYPKDGAAPAAASAPR